MTRLPPRKRFWAFAAIAALVLCAQLITLQHDFEHNPADDEDHCTICTVVAGLKHITTTPDLTVPYLAFETSIDTVVARNFHASETPVPEARAPPVHT